MAIRVQWYGAQASRQITGTVGRRVRRAGLHLVQATKAECPVDTGALSATIRLEPGDDSLQWNVVVGDESQGVDYAGFVHNGTSRSPANPFFTRAIYSSQAEMKAILAGKGDTLIGRIGGAIGGGIGRLLGLR